MSVVDVSTSARARVQSDADTGGVGTSADGRITGPSVISFSPPRTRTSWRHRRAPGPEDIRAESPPHPRVRQTVAFGSSATSVPFRQSERLARPRFPSSGPRPSGHRHHAVEDVHLGTAGGSRSTGMLLSQDTDADHLGRSRTNAVPVCESTVGGRDVLEGPVSAHEFDGASQARCLGQPDVPGHKDEVQKCGQGDVRGVIHGEVVP